MYCDLILRCFKKNDNLSCFKDLRLCRCVAAYTQVRSWIHIFFCKVRLAVKCRLVEINESKAIHLHFYAKINGFSLVKKALRRPQNAPDCTIYFKIFKRGGMTPDPPRLFWIHILYSLATRLRLWYCYCVFLDFVSMWTDLQLWNVYIVCTFYAQLPALRRLMTEKHFTLKTEVHNNRYFSYAIKAINYIFFDLRERRPQFLAKWNKNKRSKMFFYFSSLRRLDEFPCSQIKR